MKNKFLLLLTTGIALLMVAAIPLSQPASPNITFTVTSTSDETDYFLPDGVCATAISPKAKCTLRAAVMQSNYNAGNDTIELPAGNYNFSIAGEGEDNAATGDLDIRENVEIVGSGIDQTIIDGHDLDRIFHVHAGSHLTLSNLTVQNGHMHNSTRGGGIYAIGNLTLVNVKVTSNSIDGSSTTTQGGGIMVYGASGIPSKVNIEGSIISDNAAEEGGGVYASDQAEININNTQFLTNTSEIGGGIFSYGSLGADAVLTITNSLFYSNTAGAGGGIYNNGYINLTNATFSQNSANSAASGGGLLISTNGRAELLNVTIYGSPNGTGFSNNNVVTMTNSILFANLPFNCNINYPITSQGFNISLGWHCNFDQVSDLNNADPLLAPLADNGGSTRTHALLTGSPAIDIVTAGVCPAQDQRGKTRPIDGNNDGMAYCDSGAYELLLNVYLPIILR
jgi:hypothetical protein